MEASVFARAQKAIEGNWMDGDKCVCMCALFVCGIEGSWEFWIHRSKCEGVLGY
jgi:hypothetical protein